MTAATGSAPAATATVPPGEARAPALAFPALIAANAALAAGPLFVRLSDVGPVSAGFWRLAIALPVLALLAVKDWRASPPSRGLVALAALAGVFFALDLASWHAGILLTKMAHATLFGNAASPILAVTTLVVARRWATPIESIAIALTLVGAYMLMRDSGQEGPNVLLGDLLCVLAGVLYAAYVLAMQRARGGLAPFPTLAIATAAGLLPLLAIATLLGEQIVPTVWWPVIALAVSSQLIGQGLMVYALPHFSALVVGLSLLTQPAVASVIGWWVYHEQLSPIEMFGGVLVAAGLVLIRLPSRRASAEQAEG